MITMDKKYQTRSGLPVRIYATDAGGIYPVHGAILYDDGEWFMTTWTHEGLLVNGGQCSENLIEVKPSQIDQMIEWLTLRLGSPNWSAELNAALVEAKRIKAAGE